MLTDSAIALLRDVFGQPALFEGFPRITQRTVAWGDVPPVSLSHAAVVVSEQELLAELSHTPSTSSAAPDFTICTSHPLPTASAKRAFGSRRATATAVTLHQTADTQACYIEAVAEGWLFLIPKGAEAWLLAVGGASSELMRNSRLIAPLIKDSSADSAAFDAHPAIAEPLHGDDWLACGSVAIAFDPLCGDGTAQAVREAILASAVISAIAKGGDRGALLGHYKAMLTGAMRRHLHLCADYYRTGGSGPWWTSQTQAMEQGHDWCTAILATTPEPQYALHGFELVPRQASPS